MRPTTATSVIDLRPYIHPSALYDRPEDVLSDGSLNLEQKRAILASWASDAVAVHDCPNLRAPADLRRPVLVSDVLAALKRLDDTMIDPPGGKPFRRRSVSRVPEIRAHS